MRSHGAEIAAAQAATVEQIYSGRSQPSAKLFQAPVATLICHDERHTLLIQYFHAMIPYIRHLDIALNILLCLLHKAIRTNPMLRHC